MSLQTDRLLSLIEFCRESAQLRSKPIATVSGHRNFSLHENDLREIPGIKVNLNEAEGGELWLSIERLHETKPPEIEDLRLMPWIIISPDPIEQPTLRDFVEARHLVESGHELEQLEINDLETPILLTEFEEATRIREAFNMYIKSKWVPWSCEEKKRLKAIQLYRNLFTLKQKLEGEIAEVQLELVWGVGIGVWKTSIVTVSYPFITKIVELSLNSMTFALEIRPRDIEPHIELGWYAEQNNPGVTYLEKASKDFFEDAAITFSPFDRSTFEPLLKMAANNLEANGIYWPTQVTPDDRSIPNADDKLKITDTWVLFARPRTNSPYLQDLERLHKISENEEKFPPALLAIVSDPDAENIEIELPLFRGISTSNKSSAKNTLAKIRDLYFPKPFNDEQVKIVQLLDVYDGVVVQGPPGTGKTHTIANIICHFLANGKRILVTSMKDSALGVLHEQLPDEIRHLAIPLLASEQEGLKKFEHSIHKIASEVQIINREATTRDIQDLASNIDNLHSQLAQIDWDISAWSKKNLSKISIENKELEPREAAYELISNSGEYEWIPDDINITEFFEPKFNDDDIQRLREARRTLKTDIKYLNDSLPSLVEFPDSKSILKIHQDLSQLKQLQQEIEAGDVLSLIDATHETLDAVIALKGQVDELKKLKIDFQSANEKWIKLIKKYLLSEDKSKISLHLSVLGKKLIANKNALEDFLAKPVKAPDEIETNPELLKAIKNLSESRKPFGIAGFFGKNKEKKEIDTIQILGNRPANPEEWGYVASYLDLLINSRKLAIHWNAIAESMPLRTVVVSLSGALEASNLFLIFQKIEREIDLEKSILLATTELFPSWAEAYEVIKNKTHFDKLDCTLLHHVAKAKLDNIWDEKEYLQKILNGRSGLIIEEIRDFFVEALGNPFVSEDQIQKSWSELMTELSRIIDLKPKLDIVQLVTDQIAQSGAPNYAQQLREPLTSISDTLLPNNWKQSWRLKRISTYLKEIDAHDKLKLLSKNRHLLENDLSKVYKSIVVKQAWLRIAENASLSIRSALQAYLSAIQKIGKGSGKRAFRYRKDARNAADKANSAVPCWIMNHYRISESLPAKIGYFDLVIIDEASQSDLSALPALLRAKKILIVGDDKQVSPEGVGLEEEKIKSLMNRFLNNQVQTYRPQMSPERSIYDLFKVVFAKSSVMLKEHFRCVAPIIEYSKREFYNNELRPLRLPKSSERLDPPLIDVLLKDGYRDEDKNLTEAKFIVQEIKKIVTDEKFINRSIGVVSLLANKQAHLIWEMLSKELGPELLQRHRITCGDARTFQGKERDIIFLSMVVAPNEKPIIPLTRDIYAQRFNVAASRARDRVYLVRSISPEHLSDSDKFRRSLIAHFSAPFIQDEQHIKDLRKLCESPFEEEVYDELTKQGYRVIPQVPIDQFKIDLVVEGSNDSRLAIECDGDKYHGPDKWEEDRHRQSILERAGWVFWRCFASAWILRRTEMIEDLKNCLLEQGIEPIGVGYAFHNVYSEQRILSMSDFEPSNIEEIVATDVKTG